jgi:hypothetical protein
VQFGCEASCVGFGLNNGALGLALGVLKSRAAVDELFKCREDLPITPSHISWEWPPRR